MSKVLVTGGCGYVGSHALVELVRVGFDPVSIDDLSRSDESILDRVERITGRRVPNVRVNLADPAQARRCFAAHVDAAAVVHLAAYKRAAESVERPLLYWDNNLNSLLNALAGADRHGIPAFVFSSSCAVYGQPVELPVTEDAPFGAPANPYARTKQVGEQAIADLAPRSRTRFAALRYFNAVGAHESGELGERPYGEPDNLVPRLAWAALGRLPSMVVHGGDYDTKDGTCVRDYVHVSDIARAHVLAIRHLAARPSGDFAVFNLGSGTGTTVLEAIAAFQRATGRKPAYRLGPRRPGDTGAVFADNRRAGEELGWRPELGLEQMMRTAWQWERRATTKEK
ncbi:UDP-glucose 4-epimerase GalE [candidate division WOR-3 bacterium]|nr:UDP-glucose 4-epimerase GalE [candidate division WOR-3 bacterium]